MKMYENVLLANCTQLGFNQRYVTMSAWDHSFEFTPQPHIIISVHVAWDSLIELSPYLTLANTGVCPKP